MKKSDSIKSLASALTKAQSQFKSVSKDAENPFFKSKYATLGNIWDSVKQALADNGFSVINTTETSEYGFVLETMLYHISGEWISSTYLINPVKNDPQAYGSAVTYARRYSLSALLGIIAEEDDDANAATNLNASTPTKSNSYNEEKPKAKSFGNPNNPASPKQINLIKNKMKFSLIPENEYIGFIESKTGKSSYEELTNQDINTILDAFSDLSKSDFTRFADKLKPNTKEFF